MDAVEAIKDAVSNGGIGKAIYLKASAWFFDDLQEAERTIAEYAEIYQRHLQDIKEKYGASIIDKQPHDAWLSWYPEAIYLSAWEIHGKTAFIALLQDDKETPVMIEVNAYAGNEIEKLEQY